ncbi:MAG: hypothetical protein NVSMB1_24550 [Polyangiales bacterium]
MIAVVPAFNEALHIRRVIATLPNFVDRILVIDDGSTDGTGQIAASLGDARLELIRHPRTRGVGAAIARGYLRARELCADAVVVLAGDAQMDPVDLPALLLPVLRGDTDYAKGNRLLWPSGALAFPLHRLLGVLALAAATRAITGLDVDDAQCGYTVIGRRALDAIDWTSMWPSYGYPNDLLSHLAMLDLRVIDVPVRPIYADEVSKMRWRHWPPIGFVLARAALRRWVRSSGNEAPSAPRRSVMPRGGDLFVLSPPPSGL